MIFVILLYIIHEFKEKIMNKTEALKIVRERRNLQKERKKLADRMWKGKLSLPERELYQKRLKQTDNDIDEQYPHYIEAFKFLLVPN